MTFSVYRAIEAALRRAYALGRVDQAIGLAAERYPARHRLSASPYSVHHPAERAQEVALADN